VLKNDYRHGNYYDGYTKTYKNSSLTTWKNIMNALVPYSGYSSWNWSSLLPYGIYKDWYLSYDSGRVGDGSQEYYTDSHGNRESCGDDALGQISNIYNANGIKTYAIGVATDSNSVNQDFISKIAADGHGIGEFSTNPGDINSYYQYFLKEIIQKGSISQIKVTQTIPNGLEVDTASLPSGWSYNSSTRVLSGTVNDVSFSSDSLTTPAQINIPVKFKAINEGSYDNCTATISYMDISGNLQTRTFNWGKFKVNNPVTTTADIAASGNVSNTNIVKYSKIDLTYTVTPTGSVSVTNGATGSAAIKGISVNQTIPDGLTVDTASLPSGWSYDSSTKKLTGSFSDIQFNAGQSAPDAVSKTVSFMASGNGNISIPDATLTYIKEKNENGIISSDPPSNAVFHFGSITITNPVNALGRKLKVLYVHGKGQAAEITNNDDMDVTDMTIQAFISHTLMEINGNYDLIYFGKGNYISATNPNNLNSYFVNIYTIGENSNEPSLPSSELISPYDITNRMADKVEDLIKSKQLVVFNNNVFADNDSNFAKRFKTISKTGQFIDPVTNTAVTKQMVYFVDSETDADLIRKYVALGLHRPDLNVTSAPQSYASNLDGTTNKTLHFEFTAKSIDNRALTVRLYLDKNGDGKFGYIDPSTNNNLELVTTKTVPNGSSETLDYTIDNSMLTGVLYWKLEVSDGMGQKTAKTDCFLFKDKEIAMDVLQIMPNDGNAAAGNLKTLLSKTVNGNQLGYIPGTMKINVTPMLATDFNKPENYSNLNGKYDMIVMGFDDYYNKNDVTFCDGAINAIKGFIATGQGVMFTHDTICGFKNDEIRNAFLGSTGQVGQKEQSTKYCKNGSLMGTNTLAAKEVGDYNIYGPNADTLREKAKKVNDSGITKFPYQLPDILDISATHVQYYRLDLENADPWYNMYDDLATGKKVIDNDDSVNSYYTYSIGNVTFSGTGHTPSGFSSNDDEVKMFVNTIMRTYSSADHAPTLTVNKPTDNQKVGVDADIKIPVEFTASDVDSWDQDPNELTAKIYIDQNNDGTYVQSNDVYVDADNDGNYETQESGNISFKSGSTVKIAVKKGFADAKNFKIKVVVTDTKGASEYKEIPLSASQTPTLNASVNVVPGCLTGDTVAVSTTFTAAGAEVNGKIDNIKLKGEINCNSVEIDNKGNFTVSSNAAETGKLITLNTGVLSAINYNPKQNLDASNSSVGSKTVDYAVKFTAVGNYSISNNLSYNVDGVTAAPQTFGSTVDVRDGIIKVHAGCGSTNVQGIKVNILKDGTKIKDGTTDSDGNVNISGFSSGSYTASIDETTLPNTYKKPADKPLENPLSYSSNEQTINFELESTVPNISSPSISALVGGTETNELITKKDTDAKIVVKFELSTSVDSAVIKLASGGGIDFDIKGVSGSTAYSNDDKTITLGALSGGPHTIIITIQGKNKTSEAYGIGNITFDSITCNKNSTNYTTACNKSLNTTIYDQVKLK
jgi:hypothetical protein